MFPFLTLLWGGGGAVCAMPVSCEVLTSAPCHSCARCPGPGRLVTVSLWYWKDVNDLIATLSDRSRRRKDVIRIISDPLPFTRYLVVSMQSLQTGKEGFCTW